MCYTLHAVILPYILCVCVLPHVHIIIFATHMCSDYFNIVLSIVSKISMCSSLVAMGTFAKCIHHALNCYYFTNNSRTCKRSFLVFLKEENITDYIHVPQRTEIYWNLPFISFIGTFLYWIFQILIVEHNSLVISFFFEIVAVIKQFFSNI